MSGKPATGPHPLRLVIIGAGWQAAAMERRLAAAGIAIAAVAGRVTPTLLGNAAAADAMLVIAARGAGFSAETRRECLMAWGLGARPVLAVEARGASDADEVRATGEAFAAWAHRLGAPAPEWVALEADGQGIAERLAGLANALRSPAPFRMAIDGVTPSTGGCMIKGRVLSGAPASGMAVTAMPAAIEAVVTDLQGVEDLAANAGAFEIRLDRAIDAVPGQVLADAGQRPEIADQVAAHLVWAGEHPLLPGRSYELRLAGQSVTAQIGALKHKLNPVDLDPIAARQLVQGEIGFANLSFQRPIAFDAFERSPALARFALFETANAQPVGFGRIAFTLRRATNIHWQALSIDKAARAGLKGQKPSCLWLTGLSGSGKSTVASLLEKRLNAAGRHTYTLDGDNVRHGLNRDLGFTDADRVENIRRVAEVARLFVDSGLIVIVSFISPFRAERRMARDLMGEGEFLEIFVDTPIEICERRDPKGLYKKARAGALANFTGIDSPYEAPERAEVHLRGGTATPEELVDEVMRELARRGVV